MRQRKSKAWRLFLYAVAGLLGLLALAQIALLLFFDADAHKRHIEHAASAALGVEVKLLGRLSLEVLPGLHVAVRDAHVRNRGTDVLSIEHTSIGIDLLPLLRREIRIGAIRLTRPRVYIERAADGRYNIATAADVKGGEIPPFDVGRISLADAALHYSDKETGDALEARGCYFETRRLRYPGGPTAQLAQKLALAARFVCREVRRGNFAVEDFTLALNADEGVFDFRPIAMRVLGGRGSGSVRLDLSRAESVIEARYALSQVRAEELFKAVGAEQRARGTLDFTANLSLRGQREYEIRRSAAGAASIRGANLTLLGTDIDKALARYESSQRFNLVDAGAFFLAGPIGLVATKGYNFASIAREASGDTSIGRLVSDWTITRGVAHSQDVALATRANRIALRGRLDFINERFDDVAIAVIDANGCARLRQTINGPFQSPALDKPGVLASLAGPALRLFKKMTGDRCEVFYAGSVPAPN